jgi:hypothetical protein
MMELVDEGVARLVWLVIMVAGVGGGVLLLGLGWVGGYLARCRDEREGSLSEGTVTQGWLLEHRRAEHKEPPE